MKNDKKPRTININVEIEIGDSIEAILSEDAKSFSLIVFREGKKVSAKKIEQIVFYDRPKKPKIMNITKFRKSSQYRVSQHELLQQYEQVWAIDTNRREIEGHTVNVSAVTVCSTNGDSSYLAVLAIIFGETQNNPELYGWRRFIEFIVMSSQYSKERKYGLVVDSELSKLGKYNNRELAIHGTFYMPENWDLIYATSDAGKEYIFNKILAESDKTSSIVLDKISKVPSNAKYWKPITNDEEHEPYYLIFSKVNDFENDNV